MQVERRHNDRRANELIRTLSRAIHSNIIKPFDGAVDETIAGTDSMVRAAADQTSLRQIVEGDALCRSNTTKHKCCGDAIA